VVSLMHCRRVAVTAAAGILLALTPMAGAYAGNSGGGGAVAKAQAKAAAKAQQLADAKKLATEQAGKLAAAKAAVADAQQQLTVLAAAARVAIDRYKTERVLLTKARADAGAAQASLDAATQEVAREQDQVNRFVAAAYMSGGPLVGVATVLSSGNPTAVLDQSALLNQISKSQAQLLHDLGVAKATQAQFANAAATAMQAVVVKAMQVDVARRAAVRAMSDQEQLLKRLSKAQIALAQQLAAEQQHVAALTKQHADAVAAAAMAAQRRALELAWASIRQTTSSWPEATAAQGLAAVDWARKQLGVPYSWGGGNGDGPTLGMVESKTITSGAHTVGFDCSGLTLYAWSHLGFTLDHYTGYQWLEGRPVPLDQLRAGDLVFFATDVSDPLTIHHVGIYVGGNQMIDAPHTGAVVRYDQVFVPGLIGAVRP
jgi:peptidoglycan DL-endopeptidase RipA